MVNLSTVHPDISVEFNNGNFTVHKTIRAFSSIAIDQAHEQNNETVKSDGGAVGLTQNHDALRRWMVAGPEVMRITSEFEASIEGMHRKIASETLHHEQTKSIQATFAQHVNSLVGVIEEMGNQFSERSKDLLRLDTWDIIDQAVASSVGKAEEIGQHQYQAYITPPRDQASNIFHRV